MKHGQCSHPPPAKSLNTLVTSSKYSSVLTPPTRSHREAEANGLGEFGMGSSLCECFWTMTVPHTKYFGDARAKIIRITGWRVKPLLNRPTQIGRNPSINVFSILYLYSPKFLTWMSITNMALCESLPVLRQSNKTISTSFQLCVPIIIAPHMMDDQRNLALINLSFSILMRWLKHKTQSWNVSANSLSSPALQNIGREPWGSTYWSFRSRACLKLLTNTHLLLCIGTCAATDASHACIIITTHPQSTQCKSGWHSDLHCVDLAHRICLTVVYKLGCCPSQERFRSSKDDQWVDHACQIGTFSAGAARHPCLAVTTGFERLTTTCGTRFVYERCREKLSLHWIWERTSDRHAREPALFPPLQLWLAVQ